MNLYSIPWTLDDRIVKSRKSDWTANPDYSSLTLFPLYLENEMNEFTVFESISMN